MFGDFGPDLPARLGRDDLRLMVQGPTCIYAYWESSEGEALDLIVPDDSGIDVLPENGVL